MWDDPTGPGHPPERVRALLEEGAALQARVARESAGLIARAGALLIESFQRGGKVLLFGNGGSAADAQHLADEFVNRFEEERAALPALALTANGSDLSAIANDRGFEQVFARQIDAHGRPGDTAIAISTSGSSPNILAGVARARARGLRTIALTGAAGSSLAAAVDLAVVVPSKRTAYIQECHIAIGHALCRLVDDAFAPGVNVE